MPQTRIVIAFPMAAYGTEAYRHADLITDILASGQSARFTRRLVMGTDLFTSADASVSGSDEPGFLMLTGRLRRNDADSIRAAEEALWEQVSMLGIDGVSDHEMQRALNRFESNRTFANINYLAKARELARCEMQHEDINSVVSLYRSVTADDVKKTAAGLFVPDRSCTLIYRSV